MRTLVSFLAILCLASVSSAQATDSRQLQFEERQYSILESDHTHVSSQGVELPELERNYLSLWDVRSQDENIHQRAQEAYLNTQRKARAFLWTGGALLIYGGASLLNSLLDPLPTLSADRGGYWDLDQLEDYINASPLTMGQRIVRYSGIPSLVSGVVCLGGVWYYNNRGQKIIRENTPQHLNIRLRTEIDLTEAQSIVEQQNPLDNTNASLTLPGWIPGTGSLLTPDTLEIIELLKSPSFLYAKQVNIDLSEFIGLTPQDLATLLEYTQVRSLDLRNTNLTNAHCHAFSHAQHLRMLDIRGNSGITDSMLDELIQYTLHTSMRHTFMSLEGGISMFVRIGYRVIRPLLKTFQSLETFYCDVPRGSFAMEDEVKYDRSEEGEDGKFFHVLSHIQSMSGVKDFRISVLDSPFQDLEHVLRKYRIFYCFSKDAPVLFGKRSIIFNQEGFFFSVPYESKVDTDSLTFSIDSQGERFNAFLQRCAAYLRAYPPIQKDGISYHDISQYVMFDLVKNPEKECVITVEEEMALLIKHGLVKSLKVALDKD